MRSLKQIKESIGWHATNFVVNHRILENRFFYTSSLLYGKALNTLYISLGYPKQRSSIGKSIARVAFIFSRRHFDPHEDSPDRKAAYHNVSNMARNMYGLFAEKDIEIFYFDKDEDVVDIPRVDLVIGIVSKNYLKIAWTNTQADKILFIVNCHPLYRAHVLLDDSKKLQKHIPLGEWLHPSFFIKHLPQTHRMIVIGNEYVKNTFVNYGVPSDSLALMNTGVNLDFFTPSPSERPENVTRIVYVASQLGIRKGLFHVIHFWDKLNETRVSKKYELVVIGGLNSFMNEMDDFRKRHSNVKFLGWIESNTIEYKKALQSAHIVIEPSLEEGQVGCVLEAMACGAVPIISEQCGIPITEKEGFIINYDDTAGMIRAVVDIENNQTRFEENVITYIQRNHSWEKFKEDFSTHVGLSI